MPAEYRVVQRLLLTALIITSSPTAAWAIFSTGFEAPTYVSGGLPGQDGWTGSTVARVQTQTELETELTAAGLNPANAVHGGSQAVIVSGTGGTSATILPVSGLESSNRAAIDLWARPLTPGADGSTVGANLGNVFVMMEDEAQASGRATGFRFGGDPSTASTIDVYTTGGWLETGVAWQADNWYNIRLSTNYDTKTLDAFINGVQVANDIGFFQPAATHLAQIRVFRGSGQAGMIMDDLTIVPEPSTVGLALLGFGLFGYRRKR